MVTERLLASQKGLRYMELELNYNVMTYAQKTAFLHGRNGRVHILLQQIRGVDSCSLRWSGP
jgi:hypothetical protein